MAVERAARDERATRLLELPMVALPKMLTPSGLVCWEIEEGDPEPRGESVRYALIVLLGMLRAEAAGVTVPLAPDALRDAIDASLERPEVTPGDVALRLWVESRKDTGATESLVQRLDASLRANGGLAAREGLELGWIVTGLAATPELDARGRELLSESLDQLIGANQAPSGLFRHFGNPGRRRRFPNFATEIYSVLALAAAAARGVDERALSAAQRAADRLLSLQLDDGGWPWLYDAERGTVVERYEVYSVHQHGMAPMTLYELSAVSGDERYAAAADRGLPWMFGENELGADMAPLERGMTYRSIRRSRPFDRLFLIGNTATSATLRRSRAGAGKRLEINRTCRPYELGWLVEAWVAMQAPGQV
jgi:hypothetical protein